MGPVEIIEKARAAGLRFRLNEGSLRLLGPKTAEPIVREIQKNKNAVIGALMAEVDRLDGETAGLVRWFQDEGQHLIPDEPFQLTRWIRITRPAKFREYTLFQISLGPEGRNWRHGHLRGDLLLLKEKLLPTQDHQPKETR
jgi:hypothetical protein